MLDIPAESPIPGRPRACPRPQGSDAAPIRFVLSQPSLPRYRVPVFRELASRPGISLKLVHARDPAIPNAVPDGFEASYWPVRQVSRRGQDLCWHGAQIRHALGRTADVLGLPWNTRYMSLVPALLLARARSVPTLVWGHGRPKHQSQRRFALRVRVAKLATAVVVYGHAGARCVIQAGIRPEKVFVALNALDQRPIQAARSQWLREPGALESFRKHHGLDAGPVVLFVSRLYRANRVEVLIDAVARLRPRLPGITAAIVGAGPELGHLNRRAWELGLSDRVRFPGPIYDETELAPWFLAADVFCYPANAGLSLLHAMGYGLPVVTGDNIAAHNPEIEAITDGENGLLFADGDAADLADKLTRVIDDRRLRASLSAAALKTATERFTVQRMVDGLEAAIRYCAAVGYSSK